MADPRNNNNFVPRRMLLPMPEDSDEEREEAGNHVSVDVNWILYHRDALPRGSLPPRFESMQRQRLQEQEQEREERVRRRREERNSRRVRRRMMSPSEARLQRAREEETMERRFHVPPQYATLTERAAAISARVREQERAAVHRVPGTPINVPPGVPLPGMMTEGEYVQDMVLLRQLCEAYTVVGTNIPSVRDEMVQFILARHREWTAVDRRLARDRARAHRAAAEAYQHNEDALNARRENMNQDHANGL